MVTIKVFNMDISQETEVENKFVVYCVEYNRMQKGQN